MAASMIRFCAPHDIHGNPRRVYVLIRDGEVVYTWDEGYSSSDAVPTRYRRMAFKAPSFATTLTEYRVLVRDYGRR